MATLTISGSPLPTADPGDLGFIPERLAQLGPTMQRYVDDGKVPNLVTLVARHGRVAHFEARGVMDLDEPQPVQRDSIFRLYSNSKPIAGAGVMILFEEGKVTPDDPISKFIPAFKNAQVRTNQPGVTVPAQREITVRDCFRNTSGIASAGRAPMGYSGQYRTEMETLGWPGSIERAVGSRSARERVDALGKLPLSFQPGSDYEYHAGYIVIGAIIEEVTGRSLNEFYHQRIFDRIGMNDTDFYLGDGKLDRFTACYRPTNRDGRWGLT
ncbi:MAG TPA: serine hydrolase domain-containing protein, partial [Dehalococcoidia bacterium]